MACRRFGRERRGFAVSSGAVLVLLLFLGVAAAQMVQVWNRPGMTLGVAATFLALPVVLALAIAWLTYAVCRRSPTAGNVAFSIVLLIATAGRLAYMTGLIPKGTSFRNLSRNGTLLPSKPGQGSAPRPGPTAPRPSPVAVRPLPAAPAAGGAISPAGVVTRVPSPAAAAAAVTENPVIKPILDALSAEIDGEAETLISHAEAALAEVSKPPGHETAAIERRIASMRDLESESGTLAKRFRGLSDEARERLRDAGISEGDAFNASVRYVLDTHSVMRATPCDSYKRIAEAGREEAEFLRDQFASWSLDAKGDVTSKDLMVRGRARGPRMRVEMLLRNRDGLAATLRKGTP